MKNKIEDLRNLLFAQMEKLSDCHESDLEDEITRSSSMVQIAETIIDTARVENEFISLTQSHGSGFIPITLEEQKRVTQ